MLTAHPSWSLRGRAAKRKIQTAIRICIDRKPGGLLCWGVTAATPPVGRGKPPGS
jgi:hypothetical protein